MHPDAAPPWRLRSLGLGMRLGLSFLVLTFLGGLGASTVHLAWHHQNRDERPGLSADDVRGVYHGVRTRAPLRSALERGHPETLPAPAREALLTWMLGPPGPGGERPPGGNPRWAEEYDSIDLGPDAPAEIIGANCVSCHARGASDPVGKTIPLEFWDDVRALAISRDVQPMSLEILAATTHTHAISLAMMGLVAAALLAGTRLPRPLVSVLVLALGAGLFFDMASWWLAREHESLIWIIIAGGTAYNAGIAGALVLVLADLWWPVASARR